MDMNGRNVVSNNNNGLTNLSVNLDLNLSLDTFNHTGLNWVNHGGALSQEDTMMVRNTRRRSVSSMFGNQQSHLLQANNIPANYSDGLPPLFQDPAIMTRIRNQRLDQISVFPPTFRSNSTPRPQQFQGSTPIRERNFMFMGGAGATATNTQPIPHSYNSNVNLLLGRNNNNIFNQQQDPQQAQYFDWLQNNNNQQVNYGPDDSTGSLGILFPPAQESLSRPRLSLSRRNGSGLDGVGPTRRNVNNYMNFPSQDPQQYYEWLQTQNTNNQQVNYGSTNSTDSPGILFPPAQDTLGQPRLSLSGRNRPGLDGARRNLSNVLEHRSSITAIRRRRGLARAILQVFNTQSELINSILDANAGQDENIANMMPFGGLTATGDGGTVGDGNGNRNILIYSNGGLNEEEIRMSVERLMYCLSCFHSTHSGETCCICQEDYIHGEDICKLISCNHVYHFGCIKPWLMRKNFCPICKAPAMNLDNGAGPSNQATVASQL